MTVLEAESIELTPEERHRLEVQQWQMPPVTPGMTVALYKGRVHEAHPGLGQVVKLQPSGRAIFARAADGIVKGPIRHINDPRLEELEDALREGTWDYTADHKATEARLAELEQLSGAGLSQRFDELEARVKFLEELLSEPKKGKKGE